MEGWLLNFELIGWFSNIEFELEVAVMLLVGFMFFVGLLSCLKLVVFLFRFWNGLDICCCCGCFGCWNFLVIAFDDVFEKGFGLLDILNEEELLELKLDFELILVSLLLVVGLNKLFNWLSVAYLFFDVFWGVEVLEVDISGLNLVFDVGCGVGVGVGVGVVIKKKIKYYINYYMF